MTDDYKQKYEDLMRRCEEFNIWFEDHKRKMNRNLGPARTEDIQWPRDIQPVMPRTTNPWPPAQYGRCDTCGMTFTGVMGYVCYHPNCPTRVTC